MLTLETRVERLEFLAFGTAINELFVSEEFREALAVKADTVILAWSSIHGRFVFCLVLVKDLLVEFAHALV